MLLPKVSKMNLVQDLCNDLNDLFGTDKGFDSTMFEKQMSVLRGQILNLSQALKDGKSPFQLVEMPSMFEERSKDHITERLQKKAPFFSRCRGIRKLIFHRISNNIFKLFMLNKYIGKAKKESPDLKFLHQNEFECFLSFDGT